MSLGRARALLDGDRIVARRAGWTVVDQALSSASNFALGLILARTLTPRDFGAFSVGFAAYLLLLGASRALGSSVLQVRFVAVDADRQRLAIRDAAGVPLVISAAALVPLLVIAAIASEPLSDALLALAVVMPALLLQDAWRFAFFAEGTARAAAANDLMWVVVEFSLVALAVLFDAVTVGSAVLLWGLGAYAAAVFGIFQTHAVPSAKATLGWLREHRDLGLPTLGEFLLITGTWPATLLMVGAIVGLRGAASLRAAEILLGPLNLVFTAAVLLAVPEGARLYAASAERLPRALTIGGAVFAAFALLWCALGIILPTSVGESIVGSNWSSARIVMIPLAVHFAAVGFMAGSLTGLRVLEAASEAFVVRLGLTPLYLCASLIGLAIAGAAGAASGTAVASLAGAVSMERVFRRVFRSREGRRARDGGEP